MKIEQAISIMEQECPFLGSDDLKTEAFDLSIKTLKLMKKIMDNGYTGKEMQFRMAGRLFTVREMAQ